MKKEGGLCHVITAWLPIQVKIKKEGYTFKPQEQVEKCCIHNKLSPPFLFLSHACTYLEFAVFRTTMASLCIKGRQQINKLAFNVTNIF